MLDRKHHVRRLPRLILLLAGLLYLLGGAAEPVLHVYAAQAQDDSVLVEGAEQGSQPSDPSVPHGETQCSFCKIAGPLAVPSSAPVITVEVVAADELFALTSSSRAPPLYVSPHPRGPPFA